MLRVSRRRRRGNFGHGQALTEFAMLLPLLLICLVGAAQLGNILYVEVNVDSAARDGALAASESPIKSGAYQYTSFTSLQSSGTFSDGLGITCTTSSPNPTNPVCAAWMQSRASLSSLSLVLKGGQVGTELGCPSGALPDGWVTVEARATVPIFIPLIGPLFADSPGGGERTLTDIVTMRVEPCNMTDGN
jgi:Flp pilus assembly protein TadG